MSKKKKQYVLIEAKTDKGKEKIAYHGDKWELREEVDTLKFLPHFGPALVLRSRDGSKIIFVKKQDDLDIKYRLI